MSDSVISRRVRRLLAATAVLPLSIVATTALTAQQQPAATTAPAPSDARVDAVLK